MSENRDAVQTETTRRNVVFGAAAAGLAVPILAACGSSSGSDTTGTSSDPTSGSKSAAKAIKTSDVPVGGGLIVQDQQVVVTQPKAGEFKAFSSICTHEGCAVTKVADGTIDCPCHGSKYSITDGSVVSPPAPSPLPSKTVTVTGDTLTVS